MRTNKLRFSLIPMSELPFPVTELTMEQQFKIAALMGDIEKAPPEAQLAACHHLLKYNFILKNTVNRLLGSHAPDTTGADLFEKRSES